MRRSCKTYSTLCNCFPKHFELPEAVSVPAPPQRAAGQCCSGQQSSVVGLEWSTHRASNLLCCSVCCVIWAGTTTLPSLGIPDSLQDSTEVWCCQRDGFLHTTAAATRHSPEPCLGEKSPCNQQSSDTSYLQINTQHVLKEKNQTQNYLLQFAELS